ncbi:MAG: amidase [Nitriliruptorales bacterium]|nr:amidase [Nitriliruptorales bacterium]
MTDHDSLPFASAAELARLIADREVSAAELTQLYLERIERYDGDLNAFVHRMDEQALEVAELKDRHTIEGSELPPLHGVPVSIKELAFLEGAPATMATKAMADNIATFDTNIVGRLKQAGMVPIGKTNAPELGSVPYTEPDLFGPCRNPWDLERTPGGSSGGGAAALAAGLCPVSQASDGGGSIRIPASATGLYGLKPSRFRVSGAPLVGSFAMDLSTAGMLTRTVSDSAVLLDLISGYVPGDPGAAPPPPEPFGALVGRDPEQQRIGILTESPVASYSPPAHVALEAMANALEQAGHELVEVTIEVPGHVINAFELIWAAGVASLPFPAEALEPLNAWLTERGTHASAAEVYAAEFQLSAYVRQLVGRFHTEFDLLAFPVLTQLPPRIGEHDGLGDAKSTWDANVDLVGATPMVNATGQPAASVPIHWDDESGLPVGVQLVGRYADEATVLQVSRQLEEVAPWRDRVPPGYSSASASSTPSR